jgi:ABC-type Fe3+ transport system permease subunit
MRIKMFFIFFVFFWPIFLAGMIVTAVGNDLDWQWTQWRSTMTTSRLVGSMIAAIIASALFVRLQPRSGNE